MNNNRGVITLEAVMIIPIFLALIIGMLFFIRIALVQIALQHSADETIKQLAVIIYAIEPSMEQAAVKKDEGMSEILAMLPDSIRSPIEALITEQWNETITDPILAQLLKPILWYYVESTNKKKHLRYNQLTIEHVSFPFLNNNDGTLGIEVSYSFRLILPFYETTIKIHKRAKERVWIGL